MRRRARNTASSARATATATSQVGTPSPAEWAARRLSRSPARPGVAAAPSGRRAERRNGAEPPPPARALAAAFLALALRAFARAAPLTERAPPPPAAAVTAELCLFLRGAGAIGSGLRRSAISACAVTQTGVWPLARE